MPSSFFKKKYIHKIESQTREQGFILVTLPFVILIMLGLIGLAIDAGRLYITQQELQASADAALHAGVGARVSESNPELRKRDEVDYIRDRVETSFLANLAERGILTDGVLKMGGRKLRNADNFDNYFDSDVNDNEGTLTVRLTPEVEVSTMLIHLLSMGNDDINGNDNSINIVRVNVDIRIRPANIVFIADLSESSACPEQGACLCNQPAQYDELGNILPKVNCRQEANAQNLKLRFERIREAFYNFIDGFDDRRDRISLVFFNNVAWTVVPFKGAGGGIPTPGFNKAQFEAVFDNVFFQDEVPGGNFSAVVPRGNTNIADGLLEGFREAQRSGLVDLGGDSLAVSYILFTDGAPTATALVPDGTNDDALVFGLTLNCCDNAVDNQKWKVPGTDPAQWASLGIFVDRKLYKESYENDNAFRLSAPLSPDFDNWDNPDPAFFTSTVIANCHRNAGLASASKIAYFPWSNGQAPERDSAASWCLPSSTWSATLPCRIPTAGNHQGCPKTGAHLGISASLYDPFVHNQLDPSFEFNDPTLYNNSFRTIFYLSAIEAANFMREHRGTVYTLGWGDPIPVIPNDPYQIIIEEGQLKPVFLSNLANDYYGAHQIDAHGVATALHPGFPAESLNYQEKRTQGHSIGSFYQAPDAQGVQTSLNLIARQIKMKLVR